MSIKLNVEEYCQDCLDFEADVTKPTRMYADDDVVRSYRRIVVRCKYRKRCANQIRYLEQKLKGEQKD